MSNTIIAPQATLQARSIQGAIRRNGRITKAQRSALHTLWRHYGLEYTGEPLQLTTIFGRRAPVIIDIGSGNGESTLHHAQQHPENDYLAIEIYLSGIGQLLRKLHLLNLSNIRLIRADAGCVFESWLPEGTISEIFILFPDPWPKKKHHKRRLVQAAFIRDSGKVLRDNGRLFIASDWQHYARQMMALCDQEPRLCNLAGQGRFSPRPEWRKPTRYELRGIRLQHTIYNLCYAKQQIPLPPYANY